MLQKRFNRFSILFLLSIFIVQSCDNKKDGGEEVPLVPIPPPVLGIGIEWSTDPERFGDDYMQCSGKSNISIQLDFDSENAINNTIYPLIGTGEGNQYDCEVDVNAPYYVENLSTPSFTVGVSSGSYTQGDYVFTLTTNEANFSFDLVRNDDGSITRFPNDPDELESILNSIIFELRSSDGFVFVKYDTTILLTSYKVIASFESTVE